ncbi:MAG: DUF554 domain-containing protein [Actinomycetota bacterium]|nr:DUF554 domain-containing protein [Actinomycetota bacterium]
MVPGAGTVLNVATVLAGSAIGVLLRGGIPERTRSVLTDGLGLVTLLVAGLSATAVTDPALRASVGSGAVLVVLGSVALGALTGSLLHIEDRLVGLGNWLRRRGQRGGRRSGHPADGPAGGIPDGTDSGDSRRETAEDGEHRNDFVEGFVAASLLFCVGPLTILGSLSDGLGRGIELLALKATLDGFASIAFAAAYGWGVAASAGTVLVVQGALTLLGIALGDVLPADQIAALTATGGLLLAGVALRLLSIRDVPVGDLLPALAVAPALTYLSAAIVG